ncbi:MAG: ABC-type maltose transport system, permease component [Microbacterium sp.]|nr:ABC-type maltose transport system, permease component [Microbacterium sp.]
MSTTRTPARRRRWWLEVGWKYFFAAVVVFYAVFPLLYVLSAALNPRGTLSGSTALFSAIDVSNFVALGETSYWTWVGNTLLVGGISAVGAVLMGAAAAYAFSRFRFRGRRLSLTSLLIVQMFPQALAFVAIFLMLLAIGEVVPALGINSKLTLICVYLGGALGANTFLMYGFFNTIPIEIDESAKIDGASHAQIFWRLIMPLVMPILAVLASRWGLFAAGAVIAAIPVLALFLSLQRYIVGGLTQGSVKG